MQCGKTPLHYAAALVIQDPKEVKNLKKQLSELEYVMAGGGRIDKGMRVLAAGDRAKKGVVIADFGAHHDEPYKVRWDDGTESDWMKPADLLDLDRAAAGERHKEKVKELEELQAVKRENKVVTVAAMLLDSKAAVDAVDEVRREEERVRESARERDVYRQTDRQTERETGEGERHSQRPTHRASVCMCVF